MAKKSKPSAYDELNDLYSKSMDLVTELEVTTTTYRQRAPELDIKDRELMDSQVATLESDVKAYREKLNMINEEHKDWSGRPNRPNRFMACHSIGNDYLNIMTSIMSASLPLAADVISSISEGVENEQ
jgi:hypothetical protein